MFPDELRRLGEAVQKINDRLDAMEAKFVILERNVALEDQKLNGRLAIVESQKINDRLAVAETKGATLHDRLATVENQKVNDRVTTMEAKFIALDSLKINDRLVGVESGYSTLKTNVGWHVVVGVGAAVVLFGLLGVVKLNTIPDAAKEHAEREVRQAIKELNVPLLVERNVKPQVDKEIEKVPHLVNDSVLNNLQQAVVTVVDKMIASPNGKDVINKAVLDAAKGKAGVDLINELNKAQGVARLAIPDIQKARLEAEGFRAIMIANNRSVNAGSLERRDLDDRLSVAEAQIDAVKGSVGWHWYAGVGCFVVLLGLIAVLVVRTVRMAMEVKRLIHDMLQVDKLSGSMFTYLFGASNP